MSKIPESEIRKLVRELLRDILPASQLAPRDTVKPVSIANSADLTAFAVRVLDLAKDSGVDSDIRAGRMRFELEQPVSVASSTALPAAAASIGAAVGAPAPAPTMTASVKRIDKGAVTEKVVAQAAATNTRLVLGPRAVITPLAREAARKHGVGIERSS